MSSDAQLPKPLQVLLTRLARGECVLIDGATGTELDRRGATMDQEAWCAVATLTHPELLRTIHEDYIRAGAQLITSNTYANSGAMLTAAGRAGEVGELTQRAVDIALEAREQCRAGDEVVVAGSMSHMAPVNPGSQGRDWSRVPEQAKWQAYLHETAQALAASGVDLLLMEMMHDPVMAPLAIEAARETGLPLWIGYSAKAGEAGPVACSYPDMRFAEMVERAPPTAAQVCGIMHSPPEISGAALEVLRGFTDMPLMVYPDSGQFEMPHWNFSTVISEAAFVDWCLQWRDTGVQVFGGCCGLGLTHIEALAKHIR
ncbi:MAG: hypothetical protein GKR94_14445 [Gammaproteobacteria bacterium]|nr:hypothetical protein [Gammaproteobacteria bacterium]